MSALESLKPKALWSFFEQICSIPHPSKHEQQLAEHILAWANVEGIETYVDEVGNLILRKPATLGMEDRRGVILQAHLDMVPQANSDTDHDFTQDPIQPWIDGDWVKARGTTLGADNGMGMAAALAALASKDIAHGPLEVLLTIDEETGMTGAFGLKPGLLQGDILLNMDSEEEGEFCVGCAGGIDGNALFTLAQEPTPEDSQALQLAVTGLKGGHSGVDIHLGRGNANKLMARALLALDKQLELHLAEITGGSLRNAIPREAFATLVVSQDQARQVQDIVEHLLVTLRQELGDVEPDLQLGLIPVDLPAQVFNQGDSRRLLRALYACPNGPLRMSNAMAGVVETSNNLGVITTEGNQVRVQTLIRSLIDTARDDASDMIRAAFELAGADIVFTGAYPGWTPDMNSPILAAAQPLHQELFDKPAKVQVIHAGLECGLLKKVYPHWDAISFGPTICFPHSPDEKVHIPSVENFWNLLVKLLEHTPKH